MILLPLRLCTDGRENIGIGVLQALGKKDVLFVGMNARCGQSHNGKSLESFQTSPKIIPLLQGKAKGKESID
jgi:hypothetical protein